MIGDFGKYFQNKIKKLQDNASISHDLVTHHSTVFQNCYFIINGETDPPVDELRRILTENAGVCENYPVPRVTHHICNYFTEAQIKQLNKKRKLPTSAPSQLKYVNVAWVMDSIRLQKRQPEMLYLPEGLNRQQHGQPIEGFLSSRSSKSSDPKISSSSIEDIPQILDSTSEVPTIVFNSTEKISSIKTSPLSSSANPISSPSKTAVSVALTSEHPDFLNQYLKNSRLSFIGRWKSRVPVIALKYGKQPYYQDNNPSYMNFNNSNKIFGTSTNQQNKLKRIIVHIDMDCFFVSALIRHRPDLHAKPVAVAHSSSSAGYSEISSCNYIARKFGVYNGMFMTQAKEKCPQLIVLPYNFPLYEELGEKIYSVYFSSSATMIEPVSVDEVYLEFSYPLPSQGSSLEMISNTAVSKDDEIDITNISYYENIVVNLRKQIYEITDGCTASAGIADNMLLARLATKKAKPNGQFCLLTDKVNNTMNATTIEMSLPPFSNLFTNHSSSYKTNETSEHFHIITKNNDISMFDNENDNGDDEDCYRDYHSNSSNTNHMKKQKLSSSDITLPIKITTDIPIPTIANNSAANTTLQKISKVHIHQDIPKIKELLSTLPVADLPNIGYKMKTKLIEKNIFLCCDIWKYTMLLLQEWYGTNMGKMLYEYSRGMDSRHLAAIEPSKSISIEVNWGLRFSNKINAELFISEQLCPAISDRLMFANKKGKTIVIKLMIKQKTAGNPIKFLGHGKCDNISKSVTITQAIYHSKDLTIYALQLFRTLTQNIVADDLRGLGISITKLQDITNVTSMSPCSSSSSSDLCLNSNNNINNDPNIISHNTKESNNYIDKITEASSSDVQIKKTSKNHILKPTSCDSGSTSSHGAIPVRLPMPSTSITNINKYTIPITIPSSSSSINTFGNKNIKNNKESISDQVSTNMSASIFNTADSNSSNYQQSFLEALPVELREEALAQLKSLTSSICNHSNNSDMSTIPITVSASITNSNNYIIPTNNATGNTYSYAINNNTLSSSYNSTENILNNQVIVIDDFNHNDNDDDDVYIISDSLDSYNDKNSNSNSNSKHMFNRTDIISTTNNNKSEINVHSKTKSKQNKQTHTNLLKKNLVTSQLPITLGFQLQTINGQCSDTGISRKLIIENMLASNQNQFQSITTCMTKQTSDNNNIFILDVDKDEYIDTSTNQSLTNQPSTLTTNLLSTTLSKKSHNYETEESQLNRLDESANCKNIYKNRTQHIFYLEDFITLSRGLKMWLLQCSGLNQVHNVVICESGSNKLFGLTSQESSSSNQTDMLKNFSVLTWEQSEYLYQYGEWLVYNEFLDKAVCYVSVITRIITIDIIENGIVKFAKIHYNILINADKIMTEKDSDNVIRSNDNNNNKQKFIKYKNNYQGKPDQKIKSINSQNSENGEKLSLFAIVQKSLSQEDEDAHNNKSNIKNTMDYQNKDNSFISHENIKNHLCYFIHEWKKVIINLKQRIQKENLNLYDCELIFTR